MMNFKEFLALHHGTVPEDYEPTETPGYWRQKKPCGGLGICRHPIHGCLGNEGPVHHTVFFQDRFRDRGRFAPILVRFRSWHEARITHEASRSGQ